jgi:hypothetical protein
VQQWCRTAETNHKPDVAYSLVSILATRAAQWGADQELEACCEWLDKEINSGWGLARQIRAARRPKPPSLKEQAFALLEVEHGLNVEDLDLLRRALEQLDD